MFTLDEEQFEDNSEEDAAGEEISADNLPEVEEESQAEAVEEDTSMEEPPEVEDTAEESVEEENAPVDEDSAEDAIEEDGSTEELLVVEDAAEEAAPEEDHPVLEEDLPEDPIEEDGSEEPPVGEDDVEESAPEDQQPVLDEDAAEDAVEEEPPVDELLAAEEDAVVEGVVTEEDSSMEELPKMFDAVTGEDAASMAAAETAKIEELVSEWGATEDESAEVDAISSSPLFDIASGKQAPELEEEAEADEEETPVVVEPEPDDGRAWYVVHCYSGYENKVRHNLEQRIETMGMKSLIFDVVVPTEEEIEVKEGKRRSVERRVFPGYILVNMIMTEESWYVVRNTPGVTSFVGMGNEPVPLRPEEVSKIIKRMEADAPRIKVTFRQGERVRIVDGPFNDFHGTVDDIDMERAKVRVMVNFFGRETPVELDFLQVEKA